MNKKFSAMSVLYISFLLVLGLTAPVGADTIYWANWSAIDSNFASGTISLPGGMQPTVTYSGQVVTVGELGDDQAYSNTAIVAENYTRNTIFFSQAVTNPVIAIESLSTNVNSTHNAFESFSFLVQNGPGFFNGSMWQEVQNFNGKMGNGIFQLQGDVYSVSWLPQDSWNYHMLTVGVLMNTPSQAQAVPEPSTMLFLLLGLVGVAGAKRRLGAKQTVAGNHITSK